jgi:hypothetical protein
MNGNENDHVIWIGANCACYYDPPDLFIEYTRTNHGGVCMMMREETCPGI